MKIFLDTVGCRLNQSEIEQFARQFRAAGHVLVGTMEEADLVVVNTCAVTAEAESDSRQKIRQAARAGAKQIIATGCWATLNPQGAASLPGVSKVVSNAAKDRLVPDLLQIEPENTELDPLERTPIPGSRARTRAFIKVQDGCDNRCTFCITTIARGRGRSRSIADVLADVRSAQHGGAREVVLTGVHLGSWGKDFSQPGALSELVQAILADSDVPRVRLSSLEPWDLEASFFALWENPRLCPHLHLPLQSGCRGTLRRMARKTTPPAFAGLLAAARAAIPGVAITTDIIAGFPGEDENEFAESLAFVQECQFAGGHVFTYSERPGTAAAQMPGQVAYPERRKRNALVRAALAESAHSFRQGFLGQTLLVLWESALPGDGDRWKLGGLTGNYLKVHAFGKENGWNEIMPVSLEKIQGAEIWGRIQKGYNDAYDHQNRA